MSNTRSITGRTVTNINDEIYVCESDTAKRLGICVSRLRRSLALHKELGRVYLYSHPYYRDVDVTRVSEELSRYELRSALKVKPSTIAERSARKETILYGMVVYPKRRTK